MLDSSVSERFSEIISLKGIDKLLAVVSQLRNPDGGCPWDLKQTHQSLRPYLLEESYEAVEALTEGNKDLICEELGDVLLQVALHAQIAQDNRDFTFSDVAEGIADKLIRRHPHVFSDVSVENAEEVTQNWEAIKKQEKAVSQKDSGSIEESILKGVKANQPALSRALETSKKAVKVGFEWPDFNTLWQCVMSEYDELQEVLGESETLEAMTEEQRSRVEDELGDIFFASVNLARYLKVNPEVALTLSTDKFTRRFQSMEQLIAERYEGRPLEDIYEGISFEEWDALWNQAKTAVGR